MVKKHRRQKPAQFRLEEKGEWHTTTDVKTGNGVSGKKPKKKYCGNMELMKPPLSKSA
jgi:hypothetical protein